MNNIEQVKILIEKHFKKSPKGIITIGITTEEQDYIFHLNKTGIVENGNGYYGVGSISKTFISSYLCELIDQKKLYLTDRIDKFIDLSNNIEYPTILKLATHTSGYGKFIPYWQMITTLGTTGFSRRNFYRKLTGKWLDKNLNSQKVKRKKYLYSDYNYAVLGRIIECVEKDKLNIIMDKYFRQMGMNNTTYFSGEINDKKSWKWLDGNPFLASGGVRTTVEDMQQFMKYQLHNYKGILSPGYKKYIDEGKKDIYSAFSWNSFQNSNFYWHHGAMGFYRSSILIDTKRNIGVIVMATISGRRIQRMGYLNSGIYRNVKRNKSKFFEFLNDLQVSTKK